MDPVNSPYEKRVDAKHDVLQIYTHVHQNVSRSHDEIGTLHAPTKTGATTLIASSGWQIQSQQRGRHLLSQALGNWLFSLVTLFLVIAVGSRFFLAQIHTDCIRTYLSQGVAYRLLVVKSQKLHSF